MVLSDVPEVAQIKRRKDYAKHILHNTFKIINTKDLSQGDHVLDLQSYNIGYEKIKKVRRIMMKGEFYLISFDGSLKPLNYAHNCLFGKLIQG
jgi:hypothetical protein